MANTRIRYSKQDDINYVSRRVFTVGDNGYIVKLNMVEHTFQIVNAATRETVAKGGNTGSVNMLKDQAKDALIKLGYSFDEETRRGRQTL